MTTEKLKAFIHLLAETSGRLIVDAFGQSSLKIELKADSTPVTQTDRAAEDCLRGLIHRHYPEHGVIGEEFGSDRPDAEYVWVLDPIDGTKSFIAGVPLFATLIGLLHKNRPILGAIHQPILKQLCLGDNSRTTLNGQIVHVRPAPPIHNAALLTTDTTAVPIHQDRAGWERLVRSTGLLRTWGDAYGYLLVARGYADIMVDPIMNPWDLLPLIPVINGAGGSITDWQGDPHTLGTSKTSCIAAHPELHDQILMLLHSNEE